MAGQGRFCMIFSKSMLDWVDLGGVCCHEVGFACVCSACRVAQSRVLIGSIWVGSTGMMWGLLGCV